ncbi:peptide ABC transporter substrate-binding protein [Tetragenococcus solitarius]|uniref:Peptide ABC transporter substrate-binding protein n=1 Tax=Tetragenococcus solitarius TaxID=71453 RepID=A0ABP6KJQ2_9ENTE|nr:peptide ABC transporter substrate-binding protein [Tetragenococcus solitarius]
MEYFLKKKIYLSLVACSFILAGCQSGSQENTEAENQEFSMAFSGEMGSADLSLATDSYSFTTLNNAYEGLYRLDENNEPVLAGASEEAEVSEDGLIYNINLREDAQWSNGDPVTAEDYVYSWQRTVDPDTASSYAYMLAPVENAEKISDGDLEPSELGIQANSEYELEIHLEEPTPYFLSLLAFPTFFPQNESVVEEYGDEYALTSENAVYNGPFLLTNFDGSGADTSWNLEKNPDYWDADEVNLDTINFEVVAETSTAYNLFEDGQMDDVTLSGELALQNVNHEAYVVEESAMTQYLELNQEAEDSPFRNKNLREAISLLIDREHIVDSILGNGSLAAKGFVPSDLSSNPETDVDFVEDADTTLKTDVDQAQESWETAKSELGVDELSIELLTSDTDESKQLAEYMQGVLEENLEGISIEITNVPLNVRLDRSDSGDFEMVMNNWIGDYPDPMGFLELLTSDSSYNRGSWENEEYDQLIEAANNQDVNDPAARWQDMIEAERVLNEDLGVIPIYQGADAHLRSPDINGLITHPVGAQFDFKTASME